MPLESKTKVLTSASAPSAGISRPFQRKVTPAALPILATISRVARTEVCAGAMRVSWLTVWPSARTEIQEVSVARITSVSEGADFAGGCGFDFANDRMVTSFFSPASEAGVAAGAELAEGGEVADAAACGGGELGVDGRGWGAGVLAGREADGGLFGVEVDAGTGAGAA